MKWNRDAICFFPVELKNNEFRFEWVENGIGLEEVHDFSHSNIGCLLENLSHINHENVLPETKAS